MRKYSKISPLFWTGRVGDGVRGDPDAQAVASYVMTGPLVNSIGLYRLPLSLVESDIGIPRPRVDQGLEKLRDLDFARYDEETERIWVVKYMRHQWSGLNANQRKHVESMLEEHSISYLVNEFRRRYASQYGLREPTLGQGSGKGRARVGQPSANTETETITETNTEREPRAGEAGRASERAPIPEPLLEAIPEFEDLWSDRMDAAPRGKPTKTAEAKQLEVLADTLSKHGPGPVLEAVREATLGGYQGIFPEKHHRKSAAPADGVGPSFRENGPTPGPDVEVARAGIKEIIEEKLDLPDESRAGYLRDLEGYSTVDDVLALRDQAQAEASAPEARVS